MTYQTTREERKHFATLLKRCVDAYYGDDIDEMYDLVDRWVERAGFGFTSHEWGDFQELVAHATAT